jgi:hypothetical protein
MLIEKPQSDRYLTSYEVTRLNALRRGVLRRDLELGGCFSGNDKRSHTELIESVSLR